jgi:hypothetical protein
VILVASHIKIPNGVHRVMQKSLDWGGFTQMVDPMRDHTWIIDDSGRHNASRRMASEMQDVAAQDTVRAGAFNPPPAKPMSYETHSSIINSLPLFPSRDPTCSRRVYARKGELPSIETLRRYVLPAGDVDRAEVWRQVRESDARRDDRLFDVPSQQPL